MKQATKALCLGRVAVVCFFFANDFVHADDIYEANQGNNTIVKLDSSGNKTVFANSGLDVPSGLAFDSSGNLYAANLFNNTIEKFNTNGVGTVFASTGLNEPESLASDKSGNLYASNYGVDTIEKFDSSGHGSVFITSALLQTSRGLALDSHGSFYVANVISGTILKFDSSGNGTLFASGLASPVYIAIQPIPEPSTWALLAIGIGAVLGGRRLRRRSS